MRRAVATALLLTVALPAQAAKSPTTATASAVEPVQTKDITKALASLEKGKWKAARKRLVKVIAKTPDDRAAQKLLRQIDTEPKALLGASSFAYLVRPGDTYRSLAQRHIGDPLMFYALARYNGVSKPSEIKVGTTLRLPGPAQAAADPKPVQTKAAPVASRRPAKGANAKSMTAGTASPPIARPRSDSPALAGALRRQGLSALAKGNPRSAVILLERAAAADPANKLVAADLVRARRVRDAVR